MGKRARQKKQRKEEVTLQEAQSIQQRRAEQLAPVVRTTRRVTLTVFATIMLLFLGKFVNTRLGEILFLLTENGK